MRYRAAKPKNRLRAEYGRQKTYMNFGVVKKFEPRIVENAVPIANMPVVSGPDRKPS
jgi:hypothetical protein